MFGGLKGKNILREIETGVLTVMEGCTLRVPQP